MTFTLPSRQRVKHNTTSLLVPVYKPVGKTPLECVEEYRQKHQLDSSITVSYAGRLDPIAEGVLLLLVGDANKKRREYEHLPKEYEVTVLVGFATDTGDLMGKLTEVQSTVYTVQSQQKLSLRGSARRLCPEGAERRSNLISIDEIIRTLSSFVGLIEQKYPIYSSAKVRGKPLFWWARQGRLDEIEIPTHKVQIDSIELISEDTIVDTALLKYIVESVGSVKGDFRQDEIVTQWKEVLNMEFRAWISFDCAQDKLSAHHDTTPNDGIKMFTLKVTCGSGTYMRQLVADIGEKLGIPMCAYKIKRIKVGEYQLSMTKSQ